MLYNKGLFETWVPKQLQLLLMIILILPLLVVSPIYTANTIDMFSATGMLSEDIQFANNASIIGLVAGIAFIFKLKNVFSGKQLLTGSFLVLAVVSFLISLSHQMATIALLSFLMGFAKIVGMVELILPMMFIISPDGDRGRFYAIFYPIIIGFGQLGSYLSANIAYTTNWQETYRLATSISLASSLLCLVFMHNKRGFKRMPFGQLDWISLLLMVTGFFLLNYTLVYAKQQAWTASANIRYTAIGFLFCTVAFIIRQRYLEQPFMDISIFAKRSTATAILLILLMGLSLAASSLQSTFTNLLRYDSPTNAKLNLAMIPGVVIGGVLAFQWFKRNWSIKSMMLIAFTCLWVNSLMMYLMISPSFDIHILIIPQVFKGLGMCLVFIGTAFYFASQLSSAQMMSTIGIAICVRSFVGTAFFSALLSWMSYKLQWNSLNILAAGIDPSDAIAGVRGTGQQLYTSLQPQAILASVKTVFGYVSLAGILILCYILLHPFERMHHRKMIVFRKRFRGELSSGYRVPGKTPGSLSELGATGIA